MNISKYAYYAFSQKGLRTYDSATYPKTFLHAFSENGSLGAGSESSDKERFVQYEYCLAVLINCILQTIWR